MTESGAPWYREPYVWLVISVPAAAVIGGLLTLVIAATSFDGVVDDDYYRRGLEINQDLARDRRAAALGLSVRVSIAEDTQQLRLQFIPFDAPLPRALLVRFLHATRGGVDQELVVPAIGAGLYAAPAPDLVPGRWNVHIEAEDWRVRTSLHR